MAVEELRQVVRRCSKAKPRTVEVTQGADGVWLRERGVGAKLELGIHAARSCRRGGERARAGVSRSTSCMVPPQSGHLGRVWS
jgi:hypothetical protein